MLIKERATILASLVAPYDLIVNDKGLF